MTNYDIILTVLIINIIFVTYTGWRRSHRPSLRDISIIDEEEEKDEIERDPEMGPDKHTLANTQSNLRIQPPTFTITK